MPALSKLPPKGLTTSQARPAAGNVCPFQVSELPGGEVGTLHNLVGKFKTVFKLRYGCLTDVLKSRGRFLAHNRRSLRVNCHTRCPLPRLHVHKPIREWKDLFLREALPSLPQQALQTRHTTSMPAKVTTRAVLCIDSAAFTSFASHKERVTCTETVYVPRTME